MMHEDAFFADLSRAEKSVARWGAACRNPRKFQPVVKAEYNRAFDRRERAVAACVKANVFRYLRLYPSHALAFAYMVPGLYEWHLSVCDAATDDEYRIGLFAFLDACGQV